MAPRRFLSAAFGMAFFACSETSPPGPASTASDPAADDAGPASCPIADVASAPGSSGGASGASSEPSGGSASRGGSAATETSPGGTKGIAAAGAGGAAGCDPDPPIYSLADADIENGALIYGRDCEVCHGVDGEGVDDFTLSFRGTLPSRSIEEVVDAVYYGPNPSQFVSPAYGAQCLLTSEGIRDVTAYLMDAFDVTPCPSFSSLPAPCEEGVSDCWYEDDRACFSCFEGTWSYAPRGCRNQGNDSDDCAVGFSPFEQPYATCVTGESCFPPDGGICDCSGARFECML